MNNYTEHESWDVLFVSYLFDEIYHIVGETKDGACVLIFL